MRVLLGTNKAVESYKTDVDESLSHDELLERAEAAGVATDSVSDKMIAARLSGVIHKRDLPGKRTVSCAFPDEMSLMECANTITISKGIWDSHSPGDFADSGKPTWVWSDSPSLQALLAEHYGCDAGVPDDVEDTHHTESGPPGVGPDGETKAKKGGKSGAVATATATTLSLSIMMMWFLFLFQNYLRVDSGKDFQSRVMGDTASTGTGVYAAANFIALTETATAPAAADTTLTGELAAGGFARAQAAYAHTAAAANYTLSKTFTSADATTRTLQKIGVFNAATTGTLVFETAIPSPPSLVSGDQVAITETVSI